MENRVKEAEKEVLEQSVVIDKLSKASKAKAEVEEALSKAKKAVKTPVDKKKGQKVEFKPARRVPALTAPEGFRVAWKHNTPENVRRLQYEGWIPANRIEHNMDIEMGNYYKKLNDKPISVKESSIVHNELIAMLLPEEMAIAREQYHREETEKQTRSKLRPEDSRTALTQAAQIKTTMEIN